MKLIEIIKKKLASVSAMGMYINLYIRDEGGGRRGVFIKEQWEKSLLSLGPENSTGYLLDCCT